MFVIDALEIYTWWWWRWWCSFVVWGACV